MVQGGWILFLDLFLYATRGATMQVYNDTHHSSSWNLRLLLDCKLFFYLSQSHHHHPQPFVDCSPHRRGLLAVGQFSMMLSERAPLVMSLVATEDWLARCSLLVIGFPLLDPCTSRGTLGERERLKWVTLLPLVSLPIPPSHSPLQTSISCHKSCMCLLHNHPSHSVLHWDRQTCWNYMTSISGPWPPTFSGSGLDRLSARILSA